MASISKLTKYYWLRYYENGKQKSRNLKTADKKEALAILQEFEAAQTLKLNAASRLESIPSFILLSAALEKFLFTKFIAKKTNKIYRNATASFIKILTDRPLMRYTQDDFNHWQHAMRLADKSQNTIAIYSRHLHAMWAWFIKNDMAQKNIITLVRSENKKIKIIPPEDLSIILNEFSGMQLFIVKWLLYTGMRVSELVILKCSDIDMQNKIINVHNVKAKRYEAMPIIQPVFELLYEANLKNKYLIPYRSYNTLRLFWTRKIHRLVHGGKTYGRKPVAPVLKTSYSLHQLRKTCASLLANSGVNPFFLQKYLRHTNIQITLSFYISTDISQMAADINQKVDWKLPT